MHNLSVCSLFFTNKTSAPHGDTLELMYPFSNFYLSCIFNSIKSRVLILYGTLDVGVAPGINSIENSTSLWGGNPGIYSGNISWNWFKMGCFIGLSLQSPSTLLLTSVVILIWIVNKIHPFMQLILACIVVIILMDVGFNFPSNILLSPNSYKHTLT